MEKTISRSEVYAKLPLEIAKDISERTERREIKVHYRWICDQKRLLEREIIVLPRREASADYVCGEVVRRTIYREYHPRVDVTGTIIGYMFSVRHRVGNHPMRTMVR